MQSAKSEFWTGAKAAVPIILAAGPFAALFGALAIKNGLSVFEAGLMSTILYAGSSQMVGIELFSADVAPWLIVFSIFAVNARHILYSAVVGQYIKHLSFTQRYVSFFFLIDPQFALIEERHDKGIQISFAWLIGCGLTFWLPWIALTIVGALFGSLIENPAEWGIDFLLPIYFLALVMGFRKRSNWAAIVVASGAVSILAFHFVGSPWHITIGALAGIVLGASIGIPKDAKVASV
ncbi:MAG: AzlC family ABC transporter permease [Ahrensia sp.]|nr:AzlC family ABC transporter permease [Ahrensia sp.]